MESSVGPEDIHRTGLLRGVLWQVEIAESDDSFGCQDCRRSHQRNFERFDPSPGSRSPPCIRPAKMKLSSAFGTACMVSEILMAAMAAENDQMTIAVSARVGERWVCVVALWANGDLHVAD